ncbi:hypothetical protein ACHAWF_017779 [Thalassiosira exigua]
MSLPEDLFDSYVENEELLPSLVGKTAVAITHGDHRRARLRVGAHRRDKARLARPPAEPQVGTSEEDLQKYLDSESKTAIKIVECDLASFDGVKKAAEEVNREVKSYDGLDCLGLNAGIMAFDDIRTKDGFDVQMQTNQLSHFLLASLVHSSAKDAAEKRGEARVVPHSSNAREFTSALKAECFEKCEGGSLGGNDAGLVSQLMLGKGGPWARYAQTKLANAAFAVALHHKLEAIDSKVKSICCEPGYSVTELQSTPHFPRGGC